MKRQRKYLSDDSWKAMLRSYIRKLVLSDHVPLHDK